MAPNAEKPKGIRAIRSDQTRQNILTAAENLFSQLGLYGARIDEIAAEAGVNKRMIYEYFGNKETLYKIVLERVYQRLNDSEEEIIRCAETADAENAIQSLVHTYFVFLRDNPSYVRMVMWENLNEGRYFDEQNLSDIRNPIKKVLHTILINGQKQGKFIHVPDEKQLLMTLFACPFNYFSNRHTMQRIMDADFSDEQEMNRRIAFITDMLLSYLSK